MSLDFGRLGEIDPGRPASWQERIFITLDLDWAHDAVVADALDLLERRGIAATIFVTHETPLLTRMRANPAFELGIHPNFNPLLNGEHDYGKTMGEVLDRFLELVPEARSARSHSLATSSPMLDALAEKGLRCESNTFIPWETGVALKPWMAWNGTLVRVPVCWADDIHCMTGTSWDAGRLRAIPGLRVFIFHPIHLFLNTDGIERYNQARPDFRDPAALRAHVNAEGVGVRRLFADLVSGR